MRWLSIEFKIDAKELKNEGKEVIHGYWRLFPYYGVDPTELDSPVSWCHQFAADKLCAHPFLQVGVVQPLEGREEDGRGQEYQQANGKRDSLRGS